MNHRQYNIKNNRHNEHFKAMATNRTVVCLVIILGALCRGGHVMSPSRFGPPVIGKPNARAVTPDWGRITQNVDHFRPNDLRTWEMRYLNNSQFFRPGGPIFVYVGGEWTIEPTYLMTGQIFDLARDHYGYLFYTEHRYYGGSHPTADLSSENLRYLSTDQALADLAYFITYQKKTLPGSKVVLVGASYAGGVVTWARLKYPHLVDMAYSSSGVVHSVIDFYGYYEAVNDNIGRVSPQCLTTIGDAFGQLEQVIDSAGGPQHLSESFNTCRTITNEGGVQRAFFFYTISDVFAELVQYGTDYLIGVYCDVFVTTPGATALAKLTQFIRLVYGDICVDTYEDFLERYTSTELTTDYYRQWLHQLCTEYGWFTSTSSENQPFGNNVPVEFFVDVCSDLFGVQFDGTILALGVNRTNTINGSFAPRVTKVVTVQGSLDPWLRVGIVEDLNPFAPAIVVDGSSHGADMASVSDEDSPALREAKLKVRRIIGEWLLLE